MTHVLTQEVAAFMESCRVAHLATADAEGRPHVIPVCFAYRDGALWIAVDEKPKRTTRLKRLRNIEANPQIALVFDRYDEDWQRLAYVLLRGRASVLARGAEHPDAIAALRSRYPQYGTMALEDRPLIRIEPETVVTWGELT
jgi:PPOX class probable F420-dependent enzyme